MPIGVAIGTVAATAGGAALSASAQKKAAGKASATASQTADKNNALQREVFQANSATLNPYVTRGNEAGSAINSLLGISGSVAPQQAMQYGAPQVANENAFMNPSNAPMMGNEQWANGALNAMGLGSRGNSPETLRAHLEGSLEGQLSPQMMHAYQSYQQSQPMQSGQQSAPAMSAPNAFQNYLDSTGYQFQVDQGTKAANQGYAAQGSLQSGAAMKALQTYGQNTAKGFFNDYLGLLSNQQGVGLSGANALAGVGTNYANTVSANNNSAGSAIANAQLASGQATGQMWNTIGGSVGKAFGSSYGGRG